MTMEDARRRANELNALADANGELLNANQAVTYTADYFSDGTWYVRATKGFRGRSWVAEK